MAYSEAGEKIRLLRTAAGISQEQLAELASLNRVTIAKYESGRVEPGAQSLSRIADALDVSVDEILGRRSPEEVRAQEDEDIMALREQLRRDPNTRMLFDAARKATPDHIRAAAAMLRALAPEEDAE